MGAEGITVDKLRCRSTTKAIDMQRWTRGKTTIIEIMCTQGGRPVPSRCTMKHQFVVDKYKEITYKVIGSLSGHRIIKERGRTVLTKRERGIGSA